MTCHTQKIGERAIHGRQEACRQQRRDLYERARELGIEGRSVMTREQLQAAVVRAIERRLAAKTLDELHDAARALDIDGRSHMDREELIRAIRHVKCS